MSAKQFLKEKGISNNDFMDSGVADLIETLLTEYQALQLQQTGVMRSNCIDESPEPRINVNKFNDEEYNNGYFMR
jgi:hypothetical protein